MAFSEKAKKEIFEGAHGKCEHCGKKLSFGNHDEGEWGGLGAAPSRFSFVRRIRLRV